MRILWSTTKNGKMHRTTDSNMDSIPAGAFLYMPNGKYLGRKPGVAGNPYYSSEMIF